MSVGFRGAAEIERILRAPRQSNGYDIHPPKSVGWLAVPMDGENGKALP